MAGSSIIPLGEARLLAGELEEARRLAEKAVAACVAHRERGHHAWALRLLGAVAASGSAPDHAAAERHYRQALALADELGMRPLVAHCHLGLGRLVSRTERQQARTHLATAASMYREMGMRLWPDQVSAAMAALA